MAVKVRRQYAGGAAATTIGGSLASSGVTTFSIASATGWPASTTIPFYVVVSPQTSSEEKMLVTLNGTTVTVVTRGADGTTANTHAAGAAIYPVVTAVDLDEVNELASKYASTGAMVSWPSTSVVSVPRRCRRRSVNTWPRSRSAQSWISSTATN